MAGEPARRLGRRPARASPDGADGLATRNVSQNVLQALKDRLPELFGGAADLSESNLTDLKGAGEFSAQPAGRNIRFGVREHAMGGIANGIAYHGGFLPYVATFLTFSDYMRGSVRLAALTGLHVVYVWTHDSIGLGEDGPTHQPVEHYAALRAMPGLTFIRPGDPNEAVAAWRAGRRAALTGPVALALTRQKLPVLPGTADRAADGVAPGRLRAGRRRRRPMAPSTAPDVILIATGSELSLAMDAREELTAEGIRTRVVSLPCWERFEAQPGSLPRRGAAADARPAA